MGKAKVLTKDAIFKADDIKTEELFIPEWKGSVFVRSVTCSERDDLEMQFVNKKESKDKMLFRAMWVVATCVDADGNRLFTEADIDTLGTKSGKAMGRIFNKAQELSGMSDKDVEELEKNFGATTSDDSVSGSPVT